MSGLIPPFELSLAVPGFPSPLHGRGTVEAWPVLVGSAGSILAKLFVYLCHCVKIRFPIAQTSNTRESSHYNRVTEE